MERRRKPLPTWYIVHKVRGTEESVLQSNPDAVLVVRAPTVTCQCIGTKEGFTKRDDGQWVHVECMRPSSAWAKSISAVIGHGTNLIKEEK